MAKKPSKRFKCPNNWTIQQRLDCRTDKSGGPDACWTWTGHITTHGYGMMTAPRARQQTLAHREAWICANGPVPPDKPHVLHDCDNPRCVNPSHLFVGTHKENMRDMAAKGRNGSRPGMASGSAKLTDDQVRTIRAMRSTMTLTQIAQKFGVDLSTISKICLRKTWWHIKPPE